MPPAPEPSAVTPSPEPSAMTPSREPSAVTPAPEPSGASRPVKPVQPIARFAPIEEETASPSYPPEVSAGKRPEKRPAPETVAPPAGESAQAKETPPLAEQRLYTEGIRAVAAGHTEAARNTLSEILAKYPHSSKAPEALFWIGETYVLDNRCGQAVAVFRAVAVNYPENPGEAAARALSRLAELYGRMGDPENAKAALTLLLDRYPASPYAREARQQLMRLGQ